MSGAFSGIGDADVAGAGLRRVSASSAAAPRRWVRAGFAGRGCGGAAGLHGERVGCGAALPVIFWRSTRGGPLGDAWRRRAHGKR